MREGQPGYAERIAVLRQASKDGLCQADAARLIGAGTNTVIRAGKKHGITFNIGWSSPGAAQRRAYADAAASGMTKAAAARALGVSEAAITRAAKRQGLLFRAHYTPRPDGPTHNQVPAWATAAGLEEDYRDIAALHGEHAAAAQCRFLKREMERPE